MFYKKAQTKRFLVSFWPYMYVSTCLYVRVDMPNKIDNKAG